MTTKEKKRRQHGSGSVYQRCDHPTCPPLIDGPLDEETGKPTKIRPKHTCKGKWVATIEAGYTKTGGRRRIPVTGKTEAEVKTRLKNKLRELDAAGASDVSDRATVKTWSDQWLAIAVKSLRPGAYTATEGAVRNWIVPTIGHKRFSDLTPADVRAVETAQRKAGRNSSTALRTYSVLMGMLRAALVEGHRVPARVFAVKGPAKAANDRQAFEVTEALKVLAVASTLPHGSRWATGFLQGMRQGECLGLTWPEVNLTEGVLAVSWQLQALKYLDRKKKALGFRIPDGYEARHLEGAYHLVRPKSKKGWRVIPLVPWLRDALEKWQEIAPASPHGLVWPNLDGSPTDKKVDNEEFYALQDTADVHHPAGRWYVGHEMRHSTATLLMASRVPETVRVAIMGHSSVATTQGYEHADLAEARKAMEQVADRLQLGR